MSVSIQPVPQAATSVRSRAANPKTEVYVMRHGRTALDDVKRSDGWVDLPLSEQGQQGVVKTMAEHLQGVPIRRIYVSPLKRVEQTGEIIKSGLISHPDIENIQDLRTWNIGQRAGDQKAPTKPFVQMLLKNPNVKPVGGESYNEFTDRFDDSISQVLDNLIENEDGPILIVLSGSGLRHLGEELLGDRQALDLDEAGLAMLCQGMGGRWNVKLICGHKDVDDEAS